MEKIKRLFHPNRRDVWLLVARSKHPKEMRELNVQLNCRVI